jgi:hypothetical protein
VLEGTELGNAAVAEQGAQRQRRDEHSPRHRCEQPAVSAQGLRQNAAVVQLLGADVREMAASRSDRNGRRT